MSFDAQNFIDRQADSANARRAVLDRFRARPKADDPVVIQRRIEREAIARARAGRELERAARRAEDERLAATERGRIVELKRLEMLARQEAERAELARIEAERPRKVLLEAVQYMKQRTAGKRR